MIGVFKIALKREKGVFSRFFQLLNESALIFVYFEI